MNLNYLLFGVHHFFLPFFTSSQIFKYQRKLANLEFKRDFAHEFLLQHNVTKRSKNKGYATGLNATVVFECVRRLVPIDF